MKADALCPRELFDGNVQFEIPSFQRPYVWNEEDQWAPLWNDIRRVATNLVTSLGDPEALDGASAHFLGAVVVKEVSAHAGDVVRRRVIDGQQRMTTLQIVLDAAHSVISELGHEPQAEALQELILNSGNRFAGTTDRFKLWPSRSDRDAFASAMDGTAGTTNEHRIVEAHRFFAGEARSWLEGTSDDGGPTAGTQDGRVVALADVLDQRLRLVAINLGTTDDDQLIFETLNDRGTPLLAADLIKNWVFQRGTEVGANTEQWADTLWAEFDEDWWRHQISQGRYLRSRIDIFLQYWLTMRTREEIPSDGVFRSFREHAGPFLETAEGATSFLIAMCGDADHFRSFGDLDSENPAGRYYSRVVEAFELAATTPLLLWMLSEDHQVPDPQVEVGLGALESWVVRRTLLRMTMKDVNKLVVAALAALDEHPAAEAGEALSNFLVKQTADARLWPTDSDVMDGLPGQRLYGNVRQSRLRVVLGAVERQLRTERHEDVPLPPKLEIEHVMPQSWETHWNTTPPLSPEDAAARSKRVHSLGNLTLVTQKLNGPLSNRPWTDEEAATATPTGKYPGKGKRSMLQRFSLLALNKDITDEHQTAWADADITKRGTLLTEAICDIWPRPSASDSKAEVSELSSAS